MVQGDTRQKKAPDAVWLFKPHTGAYLSRLFFVLLPVHVQEPEGDGEVEKFLRIVQVALQNGFDLIQAVKEGTPMDKQILGRGHSVEVQVQIGAQGTHIFRFLLGARSFS